MAAPEPYDRTQHRDDLFPGGRPECIHADGTPTYLAGLCGGCYAAGCSARPGEPCRRDLATA